VREAGGGGLAQQGDDDAPDARQVIAAGGAGPLSVGASWRRSALPMLLVLALVAPVLAPAGTGSFGAGALAALLVALGAPVLAAGALASAGALAGAVGGLLAGPGAVDPLAARVIRLLEAAVAAGAGAPEQTMRSSRTTAWDGTDRFHRARSACFTIA
jgi:hypothetical protein